MTLWNIIRDFFVRYIFGGLTSDGLKYSDNILGTFISFIGSEDDISYPDLPTNMFFIELPNSYDGGGGYLPGSDTMWISLGDYLSTTATIAVLVLVCVAIGFGIVTLFKEVYRMITKWAF